MCLKFVNIREFYEIFKIRKNSFYDITIRLTALRSSRIRTTLATAENSNCVNVYVTTSLQGQIG